MQESVGNLRKAKALYVQRQQEWERAKEAAQRAENAAESSTEQASKLDKRKKTEEDALQKVKIISNLLYFYFFCFVLPLLLLLFLLKVTRGLEFCSLLDNFTGICPAKNTHTRTNTHQQHTSSVK